MHVHGMLTAERFNKWLKALSVANAQPEAGIALEYAQMLCIDLERLVNDPRLQEVPAYLHPDVQIRLPIINDSYRTLTSHIVQGSDLETAIKNQWEQNYQG